MVHKRCKLCGELTDNIINIKRDTYIGKDTIKVYLCIECIKQIKEE